MNRRIDWPTLVAIGLGRLRLAPESFWAMSPVELGAVLASFAPAAGSLGRDNLEALMAAHPDERQEEP